MSTASPPLLGCDFSSSPTRRKPIVLALGRATGARVVLERLEMLPTLPGFADWLARPQPWIGGFDFPFGLPRELVEHLGWPLQWRACIDHDGDTHRVALEAYPGLLARELIGQRSYKADDKARQTPERLIARKDIVHALEHGQSRLGLRLKLSHAQHDALVADASGDSLDAVLCLLQAAWAWREGPPRYGLPADLDPLEGWIVSA